MIKNVLLVSKCLFLSVFLTACVSVGPDYTASELKPVALTINEDVSVVSQKKKWWSQFDDSDLNELIDLALVHNQSLAAAQANVTAAYARFSDADLADWPKGNLAADYSAQKQTTPGFNEVRVDTRSYRVGTQLTWRLDLFGKLQRAAEAALAEAESEYYLWHDLQLSLIAQLAENYAQFKGLQARMDIAKRNIMSLESMRAIVLSRVELGFASKLDLHRIDAQLYGVKASIPRLKANSERAKNTLIALAGGHEVVNLQQTLVKKTLPELDLPLAIGDPTTLLRRRADLLAAERQLAAATANIGVNVADLYPDLSVVGFLGFLAGDASVLGDSESKAWSIAPSLSWSVFNLGSIQANIKAANANQQAAFARFQQQVLVAVSEAQTALSDYSEQQQQRHLLSAQSQASRQALSLVQVQYEAGATDLFTVLDVERSWLLAEDSLVQARIATFNAIIQVHQAFGGGFSLD